MKPAADVRKVREKLKLSQTEFAARFGFSPAVLGNDILRRSRMQSNDPKVFPHRDGDQSSATNPLARSSTSNR
jgi:hypothetical protein